MSCRALWNVWSILMAVTVNTFNSDVDNWEADIYLCIPLGATELRVIAVG